MGYRQTNRKQRSCVHQNFEINLVNLILKVPAGRSGKKPSSSWSWNSPDHSDIKKIVKKWVSKSDILLSFCETVLSCSKQSFYDEINEKLTS